jgi:hypothetical protein
MISSSSAIAIGLRAVGVDPAAAAQEVQAYLKRAAPRTRDATPTPSRLMVAS